MQSWSFIHEFSFPVLIGVHTVKGIRLMAKKGLNKEQIRRNPGERGGGGGRGRSRGGGPGGFRERDRGRGDMQMMQDRIMSMQNNMGGPGGKKGGDQSMAMMSSMQKVRSASVRVTRSNTL